VVPSTVRADLHHVAVEVATLPDQLAEVPQRSHASAAGWQALPEHITDMPELHVMADGALLSRPLARADGCPKELGVGIANFRSSELAPPVPAHDEVACKAVVDRAHRLQWRGAAKAISGHGPHGQRTVTAHNSTGAARLGSHPPARTFLDGHTEQTARHIAIRYIYLL
jgi:hypothetical protein